MAARQFVPNLRALENLFYSLAMSRPDPIRIALMGAGRMGSLHARNARDNPRIDLAWIIDPKPEPAARISAETGARAATLEAVLADEKVAGIIIASSTDAHLGDSLICLEAGKAVFCEKPLSLSSKELEAALPRLTSAALPPLFVAFNRRFDPHLAALKRRIDEGAIGRLESLHLVNHDPAPPDPAFIPRSAGLLRDFTTHDFDTASWLLDEPIVDVFAMASTLIDPQIAELGDVDTAKLILRTAHGMLCTISNSRRSGYGYDQRSQAFGSEGSIAVENVRETALISWREVGAALAPFPFGFADRYADAYRGELDHFIDVIESKASPRTGFRESLAAIRLADAAAKSLETGSVVSLASADASHA